MRFAIIAALSLAACGAGLPTSRCGVVVVGQTADYEQQIEDAVDRAFQDSPDARLHSVCRALNGWTVVAQDKVTAPTSEFNGWSDVQAGTEVGGYVWNGQIVVELDLVHILPHEMAHVAQGNDKASQMHTDWLTVVDPYLIQAEADVLGIPLDGGH